MKNAFYTTPYVLFFYIEGLSVGPKFVHVKTLSYIRRYQFEKVQMFRLRRAFFVVEVLKTVKNR